MTGIIPDGAGFRIDWQGGTKATQYLEYKTSLLSTNAWIVIYTNIPDTPVTNSYMGGPETK
jgi:hypothetical protein